MVELDFEKLFKVQMICMKIIQCHPGTNINKYWVLTSIVAFAPYTLSFLVLINCIKYYLTRADYFNAFRNGVPIVYYVSMMLNFGILIKKRFKLRNLIVWMKSDYSKACAMDKRSKKIIQRYAAKGTKITIFWGYLMVITVCMFAVKSIILTIYHSKRSGELRLTPFYEVYYPFNISELRMHNRWVYGSVYLLELYFTSMTELIFFCSSPLGPIFMLHVCGQLELVQIKFEHIFENDNVDENLNRIGEELRLAAYNCGWERVHKPSARKTLLLIVTRALKPVAVQSIFSTICLDTLTDVAGGRQRRSGASECLSFWRLLIGHYSLTKGGYGVPVILAPGHGPRLRAIDGTSK
ncbi:hypothetical protein K1T71_013253 [Dendrolimus kikuchii]|uniref:Uncharacterized protein n=1 Tax=Dendrolimus kikuchii TaxID=765133 RepID=A0ACC1CHY9_9NEOP|nr:hypothetical protein K1T71_013253 [Dendrolimus kikuchii]